MDTITKTLTVRQWRLIVIGLAVAKASNGYASVVTGKEIDELALEISRETGKFKS